MYMRWSFSIHSTVRYWLQPNVLTARVAVPSTWTTVLGQPIRMPICISPTSAPTLIDSPDGDALVAKGDVC